MDPRGIRLHGLRVVGALDLTAVGVPFALRFDGGSFEAAVNRALFRWVGMQRQKACPSGNLFATRWAMWTASVVLPIPAIPSMA